MSEQNALQDLLVYTVKGVGYWADMGRCVGTKDDEIDRFIAEALASVDSAAPDALAALAVKAANYKKRGKELFAKKNGREFSGFVPAPAKIFDIPEDRAAQVALGEQFGGKDPRVRPEIASARQDILKALKGIAVASKGNGSEDIYAATAQALASLVNDKMDKDEYEAVLKGLKK